MNTKLLIPGMDEQQARMARLFYPHAFQVTAEVAKRGTRFVHYTTADTAMRIFQKRQVWMRNATCMNDFMEIEHGRDCFLPAYNKHHDRFKAIFDSVFPNFSKKLEDLFNGWLPHFQWNTYLACFSEHDDSEDEMGRLSMWRAYGGATGVAIVMNPTPFIAPSDALKAYTSPVAYLDKPDVEHKFLEFLDGIHQNTEFVKSLGETTVLGHVFNAFRFAILCTKHIGFKEEREWRVIYGPTFAKSNHIISSIESIRGTPQPVCKIPLKDVPGLVGIEIPKLVDRVLIGPTQFPWAMRDAFIELLAGAGMTDASDRVFVSDIPLRH